MSNKRSEREREHDNRAYQMRVRAEQAMEQWRAERAAQGKPTCAQAEQ